MHEKTKQNLWQTLKYLLLSISAGAIQIAVFTPLNEFVFKDGDYGPSYFIALTASVVWNFTLNREFTFKSANNVPKAMLQVFAYYLVFTPLSIWWGIALEDVGWNEYLILGLTMIVNFVTEFLFWKFVVYKNSENTNKRALKQQEMLQREKNTKTLENYSNNADKK